MKTVTSVKRIKLLSQWLKHARPGERRFVKRVSVKLGRKWKVEE